MATEGISWSSPDYYSMLAMQSIFGNWDHALGSASLLSLSLSDIIAKHNHTNSYMYFSTSYSDTGLWGIYLISENLGNLDDLMHFTLREWTWMSIVPTMVEVERAKSQLKASLLLRLDGTTAIAEDIRRQLVTSGQRMMPRQIKNVIDVINPNEIKHVAQKYLWDCKACVVVGHGTDFHTGAPAITCSLVDFLVTYFSCRFYCLTLDTSFIFFYHSFYALVLSIYSPSPAPPRSLL